MKELLKGLKIFILVVLAISLAIYSLIFSPSLFILIMVVGIMAIILNSTNNDIETKHASKKT